MTIEVASIKPQALLFQALANPVRIQILNLLNDNPKGLNVTEICDSLKVEQTHISHSLRCLTFCGLVDWVRDGKSKVYSINQQTVRPLLSIVDRHLEKYGNNLFECDVLER